MCVSVEWNGGDGSASMALHAPGAGVGLLSAACPVMSLSASQLAACLAPSHFDKGANALPTYLAIRLDAVLQAEQL